MVFYCKDVEVKDREKVKEELQNTLLKQKI